MEFEEVREYVPGDDVRNIDWNVTARMGQPYVKKHREERELTVMLIVDVSASGLFGSQTKLKSEVAAEISAILALSAIRNNDRVGLLTFSDKVLKFIPPKKGTRHGMRVIREVLYPQEQLAQPGQPRPRTSRRLSLSTRQLRRWLAALITGAPLGPTPMIKTNIQEALRFLNSLLRRRCIAFLISDFVSADDFMWDLILTAKHHDLTACIITDIREEQMAPAGLVSLQDAETGQITVIDTNDKSFRQHFAAARREQRKQLIDSLVASNVDFVEIPTTDDYISPLVTLFERRKRRLSRAR